MSGVNGSSTSSLSEPLSSSFMASLSFLSFLSFLRFLASLFVGVSSLQRSQANSIFLHNLRYSNLMPLVGDFEGLEFPFKIDRLKAEREPKSVKQIISI